MVAIDEICKKLISAKQVFIKGLFFGFPNRKMYFFPLSWTRKNYEFRMKLTKKEKMELKQKSSNLLWKLSRYCIPIFKEVLIFASCTVQANYKGSHVKDSWLLLRSNPYFSIKLKLIVLCEWLPEINTIFWNFPFIIKNFSSICHLNLRESIMLD